jgi:hypothetical protein
VCADGTLGELEDLVIDPTAGRVTHLVIQPGRLAGGARLIPIELVPAGGEAHELLLDCTVDGASRFPTVRDVMTLGSGGFRADDPDWDMGIKDVFSMPSYDPGLMVDFHPDPDQEILMRYDRVPKGEVEIRNASGVSTADGHHAGHVHGLLVARGQITHLLLRHRRRWRPREWTVPITAIAQFASDSVALTLSMDQLKALPSTPVR